MPAAASDIAACHFIFFAYADYATPIFRFSPASIIFADITLSFFLFLHCRFILMIHFH
jgi:hypothetical protein